MAEIQASMDQRLNSMPPSQRQQYAELISEQQTLQVGSGWNVGAASRRIGRDRHVSRDRPHLPGNPLYLHRCSDAGSALRCSRCCTEGRGCTRDRIRA